MSHSEQFESFTAKLAERGYRLGRHWSHRREQSEIIGYGVIATQPGLPTPLTYSVIVEHWPDGFDLFTNGLDNAVDAAVSQILGPRPVAADENIGSIPA